MTLRFATSERSTVGIEWELQLVDMDSNDLRQAAASVIESAWTNPQLRTLVHQEMLLNTVEIASGAHREIGDCLADIREAVSHLRPLTNDLRIDLASAGSHPFARPAYQRVTDTDRYADLVERTQYWGRQMLLYGVHVHVGVESRDKVLPIINALTTRAGQLQALSASSPYWAGQDTGYASNRAMVFQQLPTSGIPRHFDRWDDLEKYTDDVLKTGIIGSFDEIRWDLRPAPHQGTVEIRVFDACTNIREVEAVASLSHTLVEHCSTLLDRGETLPTMPNWFVKENKWRSARYGLDAKLIIDADGNEEYVRDTLEKMVEELAPTAARLGCSDSLKIVTEILQMGASYQRQRDVAKAQPQNPLDAVVGLMRAEMYADRMLSAEEYLDGPWAADSLLGTR